VTRAGQGTPYQSYAYDAIGNPAQASDLGSYLYTQLGKPHAATHGGTLRYAYDANGNLATATTRTPDCVQVGRLMSWDSEDRLSLVSAAGKMTRYGYTADGQRNRKQGPSDTAYFYGQHLEVRWNAEGDQTLLTKYILRGLGVRNRHWLSPPRLAGWARRRVRRPHTAGPHRSLARGARSAAAVPLRARLHRAVHALADALPDADRPGALLALPRIRGGASRGLGRGARGGGALLREARERAAEGAVDALLVDHEEGAEAAEHEHDREEPAHARLHRPAERGY
jgi:hypothetical protein